jgi:hypothetical protein
MGVHVKDFPVGIKEAFDHLQSTFGNYRTYYGISWIDEDDHVQYYAMTPEMFNGEALEYHYKTLAIEKGEYFTETIYDFLSKTGTIREVFHYLMPDRKPLKNYPCIEWYKSNREMICMVKV